MPDVEPLAAPERGVARAVAVSTSSQLVARGFDVLVNVTVSVALVRHLGPRGYGDFVLVVTVVGLTGLLAEFGLPKLAVRDIARDPESAGAVVGTVTVIRLALAAVALALGQAVLLALGAPGTVHVAALVGGLLPVSEALLSVVVLFQVSLLQQYEAFVRLAANVLKLAAVLALVAAGAGLLALVAAPVATGFVAVVLAHAVARRRFGTRLRWDLDRQRVRHLLREALPVAPAMFVGVLYLKLDALMVGLLGTRRELGLYGAAYQPVEYLLLASAVVIQVLFPLLARAHGNDARRFEAVYRRGTDMLVALMLPVGVLLSFVATPLVDLAFEPRYSGAAAPMIVLGWALVLMTLNAWQGFTLLAAGRQRVNLAYLVLAVAVNAVLDVFLVPWLGPVGAAWGTLLSAALLVVCSTVAVHVLAGASLSAGRALRVGAANAVLAGVVGALLALGLAWPAAGAAGLAAYPLALAACRVVGPADLRALRRSEPAVDLVAAEAEGAAGAAAEDAPDAAVQGAAVPVAGAPLAPAVPGGAP